MTAIVSFFPWDWVFNIFCEFSHQEKDALDPGRWVRWGWHGCCHYFTLHLMRGEFHKEVIRSVQSGHLWMWSGSLISFRQVWSVMGGAVSCPLKGNTAQSGGGAWHQGARLLFQLELLYSSQTMGSFLNFWFICYFLNSWPRYGLPWWLSG